MIWFTRLMVQIMCARSEKNSTPAPSFSEEFGNALAYGWGPITVSLLFSAALALPDAAHEALFSLAENATRSAVGAAAALLTVIAFYFLPPSLYLFTKYALDTPRFLRLHATRAEEVILTWVGRLPLLAAAFAATAVLTGEDTVSPPARSVLAFFVAFCAVVALTGIWVFFPRDLRSRIQAWRQTSSGWPAATFRALYALYEGLRDVGIRYQHWAFVVGLAILVMLVFLPQWSVGLGPIAVSIFAVMLVAMCLALLTRLSARYSYGQMPLVFAVAGMVMAGTGTTGRWFFLAMAMIYALAVFVRPRLSSGQEKAVAGLVLIAAVLLAGWGHLRRDTCGALSGCYLLRAAPVDAGRPDMTGAYADWLRLRREAGYDGPVRLIAAEGGGLFSGYYTALYLAKRADAEGDAFTRSVFAISGVSGGSVGAAAFWAIVRSGACRNAAPADQCHQRIAREILGRDYLTPVMAWMFTRDLADRLLPYSSIWTDSRNDRAYQLEIMLSDRTARAISDYRGADDGAGPRDLDQPLAAGWSPEAGVPALFLNTTRVWDGGRLILSPFDRIGAGPDGLMAGAGLPVSTAAFMSARFPVVTAAARLQGDSGVRQIVDGGYFDNSGMETSSDILEAIRPLTTDRPIELVALTTVTREDQAQARDAIRGTLGTPAGAFLGAWRSRLTTVWARLAARWDPPAAPTEPRTHVALFKLPLEELNYTVSWFLDRTSFCRIEQNLNHALLQTRSSPPPEILSTPENCPPMRQNPAAP